MAFLSRQARKLKLASHFFSSIGKRGLRRTVKIACYELYCDRKFGGKTGIVIPVNQLDGEPEASQHASAYFPSSYLVLKEAFAAGQVEYRDGVFVDFGCGLGRALLFASELPLRRLIGVELSSALCASARDNLVRFYRRAGKTVPEWSIVNADARAFDIPDDSTIFYFFNPFDAEVLGAVVERLLASIRRAPRDCTIVYANPIHEATISAHSAIAVKVRSPDYVIYHLNAAAFASRPPTADTAAAT
jgi:SAM-dependent methyltransferase